MGLRDGGERAQVSGPITAGDLSVVTKQLGRPPRAAQAVAHRCSCELPDVVRTAPRLSDGTPFPTLYYLTCPRARSAVGRLEAAGVMAELTDKLAGDPGLAERYRQAHQAYLDDRARSGEVPQIAGISAGGMPTRVKCLHALLAHALGAGPGVNPLGEQVLDLLPDWGAGGPCVQRDAEQGGE